MRRLIVSIVTCGGLLASMTAASAQSFGVDVRVGPVYGYADYGRYPRHGSYGAYGYMAAPYPTARSSQFYSDAYDDAPAYDSGSCGTYFYWDSERCVDARNK